MTSFGKQGASPNPLQRYLVGRPVMARTMVVALFCVPFPVYLVFMGFVDAAAIVFVLIAGPGFLVMRYMPEKLTRDEEWHTAVPYLPWPRSWPGWRDSSELLAEERMRVKPIDIPSQMTPEKEKERDDHE